MALINYEELEQRLDKNDEAIGLLLQSQEALLRRVKALETPAPGKTEFRFKLTLPINKFGGLTGEALEIPYIEIPNLLDSPYYDEPTGGVANYFVPAKGATTDNAKYPRTERRYYLFDPNSPQRDDGFDTMINMERGKFTWGRKQDIHFTHLPTGGKCVFRQSHAVEAPPDWKAIVTAKGEVYILCKLTDASTTDDGRLDLTGNGLPLIPRMEGGLQPFVFSTWFDGNVLKASLNNGPTQSITFNKKSLWYPKEGTYNAADTEVRATFRDLQV